MNAPTTGRHVVALLALAAAFAMTGCSLKWLPFVGKERVLPAIAFELPGRYSSPDGMALGPDNCIYLSMSNLANQSQPACIVRITPDDRLEEVCELAPHPETGSARPMGLAFGADGNLYVADNQAFSTSTPNQSRLLRVTMANGRAVRCDAVATGLSFANGVAYRGQAIYICDSAIATGSPTLSGVYRFGLEEMSAASGPIAVTGPRDPHLLVTLNTRSTNHPYGANGIAFDSRGRMYVCNFGDNEIWRFDLGPGSAIARAELFCDGGGLRSVDGVQVDENDVLWVADFLGNAVARIDSRTGNPIVLARNRPGDGQGGALDAPSECLRRGDRLYISNIDLTYGPHTADDYHTISVLPLGTD